MSAFPPVVGLLPAVFPLIILRELLTWVAVIGLGPVLLFYCALELYSLFYGLYPEAAVTAVRLLN